MRCVLALINDATYSRATNQSELDAENNKSIPDAPDPRGQMGKVLRGCNDPTIGSYNLYHLSPNGIPGGNQRWYGLVYLEYTLLVNLG